MLNVITGPGGRTGDALVRHPLIRKVAITGSVEGGEQVMRAAADGIKRVTLELGGQCPCIVWHDAEIDKAVDAITFQAFAAAARCATESTVSTSTRMSCDEVVTHRLAACRLEVVAATASRKASTSGRW